MTRFKTEYTAKDCKVSISRVHLPNAKGDRDEMEIEIEDARSGMIVTRVRMSMYDFAMALTGLSACNGEFDFLAGVESVANFGKKKELKRFVIADKRFYGNDKEALKIIEDECDKQKFYEDGWIIWNDGLSTQQNNKAGHEVILYRYV